MTTTHEDPGPARRLYADGHSLEYRVTGRASADGPTLVFLHEGLGSVDQWRDFPDAVAARTGLRAFVYSRAGYGRSDPVALPRPVDFMHHEATVVLPQVLDAAAIKRAVLIGHSDGGSIALIHAAGEHGGRIKGIATLAAHVFNEAVTVRSIQAARDAFEEGDLRRRLKRYHGDNVDCAFRGWCDVWLSEEFRQWNIEELLGSIQVPLLVIQGANDEYGSDAQVDAIVRGTGDGVTTLMLPDCRHAPHFDRPDDVLEAIVDFVGKLRR